MLQIEDETIFRAQTYEIIYTQSRYLYTMLSHAPRPTSSMSSTPSISDATDGLIGSMHQQLGPFPTQVHLYATLHFTSPYRGDPLPMYVQPFLGK